VRAFATAIAAAMLAGGASHTSAGSLIVFAADRAPEISGDVYRVDANGRVLNLTRSPWQDTQPLVSPDGKLVAFLSDRAGGSLWVVGIDGRGLRQIPAKGLPSQQYVGMAWAPNSREVALTVGTVNHELLTVAGLGMQPRVLARGTGFGSPEWSPDGRLITAAAFGEIDAYTSHGTRAWSVPGNAGPGWSSRGLFATGPYDGAAHVVDEQGRQVFQVHAQSAAWSPDGTKIASVLGRRLVVRTSAGSVVLRATLPPRLGGVFWISALRVGVGDQWSGASAVDLRTGKVVPFDAASFGLNTLRGTTFAVRDGTHVYTHVPGCDDDGGPVAAIEALQHVPGTRSVVYASHCAEPFDNLYAMNGDGTGLHRLTNDRAQETAPHISPDGTQIAYEWADATGLSCKGCATSVRTLGVDGSAGATLTHPPDCTFDNSPTWSPDGTQLAFSHSSCSLVPTLMTIPASGGAARSLKLEASQAAWGPKLIATMNGGTDPSSIWTVRPDGTDATKVGAGNVSSPTWSADGRLAYLDGTTVVVQGKRERLPFRQVKSVAWSPDGTRLLVAAKPTNAPTLDLYTVKTDGTDPHRLTQNLDVSGGDWR
jgi:Tol biopolymer transport system component